MTEHELRICVQTAPERTELRYFASPQDHEGTTIRLTPAERGQLIAALLRDGTAFIARVDSKP